MNKMKRHVAGMIPVIFLLAIAGPFSRAYAQGKPITFSAFGDIPYNNSEYALIQQYAVNHNLYSPSAFIVHIGDMLTGSCDEKKYADLAQIMKGFKAPAYFVVGDNEYTDCDNPAQGLAYWKKYFLNFEQNFCGAPLAEHQSLRSENFSFMWNGVLFIGINLVGASTIHDQNEWDIRMQDDADWVSQQFHTKVSQVRAAVIFAQTGNRTAVIPFTTQFRAAAATFAKPVLYIHGDLHSYKFDQPWPEKNIVRIQVPLGAAEPPLEVTVTMNSNPPSAFAVKRNPWGSTPYNMPPCVNAGLDQTIASGATANLPGSATDDGDPGSSLTTTWSSISGPGSVTFGNAQALTTTAQFSLSGTYVLSLTASDGQFTKSDEVTIVVESAGPKLAINDVSLNEGNSGTSAAVFTVSLTQPNGQPVTVAYQIVNGTATNLDDYTAIPDTGTITFNDTTTQTIAVTINGDVVDEQQDETFLVNLSNPTNATIVDQQGVGTIINDDQPVPPATPSGLAASANNPTTVTLTWNDHAADETGFKIERKVGGVFNQIAVVAADVVAFMETGLNSNTAYTYRVRAYNVAGNSAYSNEISVSTPGVSSLTINTVGSGAVIADPMNAVYLNGTVVTLTATPEAGFRFGGWSGDLSGSDNPVTLTMNQNKTVTATFIRVVTVTANTSGSGTIMVDPVGGLYDAGTNVKVTATPATGFRFAGWSGDLSGSNNPTSLFLDDNKTITAIFTRAMTLTATSVGSGTVMLNPPGGVYDENTVVTLTAIPQSGTPGSQFDAWSGDLSGATNPAPITMSTDKNVAANFSSLAAGIAHEETRIGGISNSTMVTTLGSLTGVSGHLYLAAISMRPKVSVLVVSGLGLNWTLVRAKCAGRNTTTIEVWMAQGVPSSNGPVTATFAGAPSTATIAVSRYSGVAASNPIGNTLAGNTSGVNANGACSGGVDNNAYSFNLAATMSGAFVYSTAAIKGAIHTPGQNYAERAEVLQTAGASTSGVTVQDRIVTSPATIAANGSFDSAVDWAVVALEIKPRNVTQFTLTTITIGSGSIELNKPGGIYNEGEKVALTAMPAPGFKFAGWSGDLSGSDNPATLTMNQNKTVTAAFIRVVTLTANMSGSGTIMVDPAGGLYDAGTTVTVTATPATGFRFAGWSGDLSGSNNPASLLLDDNKTITAVFTRVLKLTTASVSSGTVMLNPPGGVYAENTVVTLTAIPQNGTPGFQFKTWSGDLSGSANPATITMSADKSVTANFSSLAGGIAHEETRLGGISAAATVTTSGSLTGVNGHLYLAAISMRPKVSVLAVSGLGLNWTLVRAKCAGRNTTGIEVWMARGTPTMNGSVTATFSVVPSTAVIAVSRYSGVAESNPLGNILAGNANGMNASGACSGGIDNNAYSFNLATTMSGAIVYGAAAIKGATHTPGQNFAELAEVVQTAGTNTSGVAVEDRTFETAGIFSIDGAFSAAVDWAMVALEIKPQQYMITLNTVGSGNITLDSPSGVYRIGATATLTAMPAPGFLFSGWSGDLTGSVNPVTLTMNTNKRVTALFTALPPPRTLTVNTVGSGSVALNPTHEFYDDGTTVTLTATPAAGFVFAGWDGDLTGMLNPAIMTMNANKAVSATFIVTNLNLAKRHPVAASSTYSGKPPENVVDSSASTYWRSGSSSVPVWLRVDLGALLPVGRVLINWYSSYYALNYAIQISNDDVNWQSVASLTGKSGVQTIGLSPQTARYVRLYFTKGNAGSYRVVEFEVYSGAAAASKRSSKEPAEPAAPNDFLLQQNYPNPFSASGTTGNPSTRIAFSLPQAVPVTIKVYTINGAEIATIVNQHYQAGVHEVSYKPKNLPSGTYLYVMQAGAARSVRRMTLVR